MEAMTGSLSAEAKRALLSKLLGERASRPRQGRLSEGQLRLWSLRTLDPESPVYNLGFAYRLRGSIDVDALGHAIATLAKRHESLRSSFATVDGGPVVVVSPESDVRLNLVAMTDSETEGLARETARGPFDLTRAPLWRFTLASRCQNDHTLLVATHHIIADRWSVGLLIQELAAEYAALVDGRLSPLSEPAGSYTEAIRQIEGSLTEADLRSQLDHWSETYRGEVSELILPTDLRPTGPPTYRGARRSFALPADVAARIDALSADEGVTPYATMLAALTVCLHRDTGQTDLVIATPVAGRHRAASRGVVGYFNNILPLRLDLSGRPTFREAIRATDRSVRDAFAHQDAPFHRIVEQPGLDHLNVTRCAFSLQNTTSMALDLPGIASDYDDVATDTSNFDLAVFLEAYAGTYRGIVDVRTDLWSPAALDGFVARFQSLVEALVAEPDQPIADQRADSHAPDRVNTPSPATSGAEARPRNEMERRLVGIWEDVLGIRPLGPDSHFFALGGRSMTAARLIERTGRAIGRELPLAALLRAPTIREFSDLILGEGDAPFWASLVPIQPMGSRPPFFCVHGGGGGVLSYVRLADALGPDQPLLGLQVPRFEEEDGATPDVEVLAGIYIDAIRSVQPEGPYHIGGHSFGGLVAYEMARCLKEQGQEVALLVLIDAAGLDARATALDHLRLTLYALSQLEPRQKIRYILDRLTWRIRKNERMPTFLRKAATGLVKGYGWTNMEQRLKNVTATMAALKSYRPGPFDGRLTLFRAQMGSHSINSDPAGGWGGVVLGGVEVHDFPCNHLGMLELPNVIKLGATLTDCLDRSRRQVATSNHATSVTVL